MTGLWIVHESLENDGPTCVDVDGHSEIKDPPEKPFAHILLSRGDGDRPHYSPSKELKRLG